MRRRALDSLRAVTSDELLPIAGLVAALGVALLLVERGAILRLAGIAAAVAGCVPLIDAQAPGLSDAVDRSPLLVGAAGVGRASRRSCSAPPSRCGGRGWSRSPAS